MRALAKSPRERFQSAAEFLSALEGASRNLAKNLTVTRIEMIGTDAPTSPKPTPRPPGLFAEHATAGVSSSRGSKEYGPGVLEDISQQLAAYVGPIAKVLVKRASSSSGNLRELCDSVAKEIDSEHGRKSFLTSVRKHLRASGEF